MTDTINLITAILGISIIAVLWSVLYLVWIDIRYAQEQDKKHNQKKKGIL